MSSEYQDPILEQAQYQIGEADPFIQNIKMEYMNSTTNPIILDEFSKDLQKTKYFSQLYTNIIKFQQKLDESKMFKKADVKLKADPNQLNSIKVTVDLQDKSPYFASVFNGYDEGAVMSIKGGYRNLLGLCDTTQIEFNKSLNQNIKKNSFNLNQQLPVFIFGSQAQYGYIYGQRQFDKGIEEQHSTQFFRLTKNNSMLSFENSTRMNSFDLDYVKGFESDLERSDKLSTKFNYQLLNTIRKNRRYKGQQVDINTEFSLPFSQTKFFKVDVKARFFNQINGINRISSRLYKNTNFEHNLYAGLILPLRGSKLTLNDKFFQTNVRGFTSIHQETLGNQLLMKWSSKWLFYDYPYISEQSKMVLPFWFSNVQYSNELKNLNKFNKDGLRGCMGLGFGVELGVGVRLEFLYNMFHLQQIGDVKNNLQIRFSIDD